MPVINCLHGHEIELQMEQMGQRIACPLCQLLMTVTPPKPGEPLTPKYEVLCDNGHLLRVKSKYLGTHIRCPHCQLAVLVTTNRLKKHTSTAATETPVLPTPVQPKELPATVPTLIVSAQTLANIPIAEVDEEYTRARQSKAVTRQDDDDERDGEELTKAERRNLKLVDQGLGYWLGGVVGFCTIYLVTTILGFFISMFFHGVSTQKGFQTLGTINEIIGWTVLIATLLNLLLYLGGKVLTMFTPWTTGATIWFILSLAITACFIGFRLFLMTRAGIWGSLAATFTLSSTVLAGKLFYLMNEILFLIMWLLMIIGLWQLGKFARKPMTRQRVMLMGMLGTGFWVVLVFHPLLSEYFPVSSQTALWIVLTFKLLLTLAMGGLLIFQHIKVVSEVRSVIHRRR